MFKNNVYCVKTRILTNYLLDKGFTLKKIDDDRNKPNKWIFLFEYSDELLDAITKFTNSFKK